MEIEKINQELKHINDNIIFLNDKKNKAIDFIDKKAITVLINSLQIKQVRLAKKKIKCLKLLYLDQ